MGSTRVAAVALMFLGVVVLGSAKLWGFLTFDVYFNRTDPVFYVVSFSASLQAFLLYTAVALILGLTRKEKFGSFSASLLVSLAVSMLLVAILKSMFRIPRPPLSGSPGYGFPSGHATRAAVLAYHMKTRKSRFLAWGWATAVALSRVCVGAHWLSDVVAGLLLGVLTPMLVEVLVLEVRRRL